MNFFDFMGDTNMLRPFVADWQLAQGVEKEDIVQRITCAAITERRARHSRRCQCLLLAFLAILGLTGCTRSVRPQANKVAAAGKITSEQMAAYYDTLAKDTVDVWEMTAFQRGFSGLPRTELTQALQKAYSDRYLALLARKRFANTISATYTQFGNLASYDSSEEVIASVGKLNEAVQSLRGRPLIAPGSAAAPVSATSAINALVTELQTVAENRAILRENQRLIALVDRVRAVFDAELPVYQSIADDKRRVYTEAAQGLVRGKAVDSTALVSRVLEAYELKWPTPAPVFTDPNLINAVVEVIEARATPIARISQDAGEEISDALGVLVSLHRKVVAGGPLTFQEMVQQNALVQDLLDALKARTNIDVVRIIGTAEAR